MPRPDATPFRHKRWKPLRKRIFGRDGNTCQIRNPGCTTDADDLDHIWSWRLGRQFWFDETNLRAACARCNRGRRGELVVADRDILPEGVTATATDIVLVDKALGRIWLLNLETRNLIDAKGGTNASQTKTDDEW